MKITIEFDPGELARSAAQSAMQLGSNAPIAAPATVVAATQLGAIDAGPAPGTTATTTGAAMSEIPAELAAQAAAIGAISAGSAPNLN
jgi:hypothetical protein